MCGSPRLCIMEKRSLVMVQVIVVTAEEQHEEHGLTAIVAVIACGRNIHNSTNGIHNSYINTTSHSSYSSRCGNSNMCNKNPTGEYRVLCI